MKRHATLPQLKKFDVTQKILEALADVESRAIIFTMVNEAMTASDLSYALKIPLSSVYKKLSDLQELTLVHVEKNILTEDGMNLLHNPPNTNASVNQKMVTDMTDPTLKSYNSSSEIDATSGFSGNMITTVHKIHRYPANARTFFCPCRNLDA